MHQQIRKNRVKKATRMSIWSVLLAALLAAMLPAQAMAQTSCNPNLDFGLANPGPIFLGDTVRISANLGAKEIEGGPQPAFQDIYAFGYALNCKPGQDFASCESEGNVVEFDPTSLSTDCKRPDGTPVEFNFPEDNVIEISTLGGPIRTGAKQQCTVEFDATIISLAPGDDSLIIQAMGWPVAGFPATKCSNGLTSSASSTLGLFVRECAIDVQKEVSVDNETWFAADSPESAPALQLGGTAYYRLIVKNTGTAHFVAPVSIFDEELGISTTIPALSAGQEVTLTGDQISQLTSVGRCKVVGNLNNTATASSVCRIGDPGVSASAENNAYLVCEGTPSVDIEKATNGFDADTPTGPQIPVGGAVSWTYVVTNDGTLPLTDILVTDNQGVEVTCPSTALAVDASMTCSGSGIAVAGQYANLGSVTAVSAAGEVSDSDPSHYFGVAAAIDIEKATNGEDADTPTGPQIPVGEAVTWTYVVTNTSNVELTAVSVTDNQGVAVSCPSTTLAVGESMTCSGSGIAVAGQYANIGTATGTPPVGPPVTGTDPSHYFGVASSITIEKATNGFDADSAPGPQIVVGDPVNWTYVVTNTSNETLSSVTVTDNQGVAVSCPSTTLTVGESMTCNGSGIAVAGQYANIGTATGTPPVGPPVTDTDPSHYFGVTAAIDIEKATNGEDADTPTGPQIPVGDAVTWTYVVTNNSNVALTSIAVTDNQGVTVSCPTDTLAAGVSMTCTGSGTATAGQYANIGTATGTPPVGPPVTGTDPSHYFGVASSITIEKATNGFDADSAPGPQILVGDPVNWTYVVTNTSNETLSSVTVTDNQGVVVSCPSTTLTVGESMTCNGSGIAVAGQYANIGTATGTPPVGPPVTDTDPSHYFGVTAAIDIEKATNGEDADTPTGPQIPVGEAVTWTYVVTNTSNVELTAVSVTDNQGVAVSCPSTTLAVGESMTCNGSGIAVAGQYANIGTATGTPPVGPPVTGTDPSHYFGTGTPSILIVKEISVDGGINWADANNVGSAAIAVFPSDALYRFTVTNNGTAPLKDVVVDDSELGITGVDEYVIGDMAVGQVVVITIAEEPLLLVEGRCEGRGTFTNTATASGLSAENDAPVSDDDAAVLKCIGEPHITIVKEISLTGGEPWYDDITPPQEWPSDAWYRITVTNDGTAPLENVEMLDGDLLTGKVIGDLAVNQAVVLESGQLPELYQEDRCVGAGTVGNLASVSGNSVDDPADTVDDSDTANLLCVGSPMIEVLKDISVDNVNFFPADSEGEALTTQAPSNAWYRITVKNTGPVDLVDVVMSDGALGIFNYPVGNIAAGQQIVLTSGEIGDLYFPGRCTGKGTFGNTVNVSGVSVETGTTSTDSDEAWLECTGTPDIQIAKDISVDGGITWYTDTTPSLLPPRDALYRLTVTNTGTTDLDGVVVNDTTLGIVDHPVGYLAINQTVVLSAGEISELLQENRCTSAGNFVNTATAEGTSVEWPYGTTSDSDTATLVCGEPVDICDVVGRPSVLYLEYNGTYESNNSQGFVGVPDLVGPIPSSPVIVELYDKDQLEATHVGVTVGFEMPVWGFWTPSGKIPPNIKVIVKSLDGSTLQTIKFHGSCSLPLIEDDEFGAVTISGFKP